MASAATATGASGARRADVGDPLRTFDPRSIFSSFSLSYDEKLFLQRLNLIINLSKFLECHVFPVEDNRILQNIIPILIEMMEKQEYITLQTLEAKLRALFPDASITQIHRIIESIKQEFFDAEILVDVTLESTHARLHPQLDEIQLQHSFYSWAYEISEGETPVYLSLNQLDPERYFFSLIRPILETSAVFSSRSLLAASHLRQPKGGKRFHLVHNDLVRAVHDAGMHFLTQIQTLFRARETSFYSFQGHIPRAWLDRLNAIVDNNSRLLQCFHENARVKTPKDVYEAWHEVCQHYELSEDERTLLKSQKAALLPESELQAIMEQLFPDNNRTYSGLKRLMFEIFDFLDQKRGKISFVCIDGIHRRITEPRTDEDVTAIEAKIKQFFAGDVAFWKQVLRKIQGDTTISGDLQAGLYTIIYKQRDSLRVFLRTCLDYIKQDRVFELEQLSKHPDLHDTRYTSKVRSLRSSASRAITASVGATTDMDSKRLDFNRRFGWALDEHERAALTFFGYITALEMFINSGGKDPHGTQLISPSDNAVTSLIVQKFIEHYKSTYSWEGFDFNGLIEYLNSILRYNADKNASVTRIIQLYFYNQPEVPYITLQYEMNPHKLEESPDKYKRFYPSHLNPDVYLSNVLFDLFRRETSGRSTSTDSPPGPDGAAGPPLHEIRGAAAAGVGAGGGEPAASVSKSSVTLAPIRKKLSSRTKRVLALLRDFLYRMTMTINGSVSIRSNPDMETLLRSIIRKNQGMIDQIQAAILPEDAMLQPYFKDIDLTPDELDLIRAANISCTRPPTAAAADGEARLSWVENLSAESVKKCLIDAYNIALEYLDAEEIIPRPRIEDKIIRVDSPGRVKRPGGLYDSTIIRINTILEPLLTNMSMIRLTLMTNTSIPPDQKSSLIAILTRYAEAVHSLKDHLIDAINDAHTKESIHYEKTYDLGLIAAAMDETNTGAAYVVRTPIGGGGGSGGGGDLAAIHLGPDATWDQPQNV